MSTAVKLGGFVLAFATVCWAQYGLTVRNRTNPRWPAAEAQEIYLSAYAAVQREFGRTLPLAPQVTLVLGADKNEVWFTGREIRLTQMESSHFCSGSGLAGVRGFDARAAKTGHSYKGRELGRFSR